MTYNFNLWSQVHRKLQIIEKNIDQINFYFVEEGPGHGSEDIKKECNINCFDFFFFSVFFMIMGGKITINLIELY
jgi:hypothetical protein